MWNEIIMALMMTEKRSAKKLIKADNSIYVKEC